MITNYVLYLASNSASRKKLLQDAQIPFQVIEQDADESQVSVEQSLHDIAMQIARLKMEHAQIPAGKIEGEICFVVTADTIGQTRSGRILHKPVDLADALLMLNEARHGVLTVTGFCLRKFQWMQDQWSVQQEIIDYDQADTIFDVPDSKIDFYCNAVPFLTVNGAISIEGVGEQFLKTIHGNYGAVVGLPIFKIRQALEEMGLK